MSLDNYFKTRDPATAPRTADGEYDLESPLCLDMDLLDETFTRLSRGEEVIISIRSMILSEASTPR